MFQISKVNSQILYWCPDNTHKSALSKAMLHLDLIKDNLCLTISLTLAMGFQDWPGMWKGMWRKELFQGNFLDSISLLPCSKAGECSTKLSLNVASLSQMGTMAFFFSPKIPCEFPIKQRETSRSGPHPLALPYLFPMGPTFPLSLLASKRRAAFLRPPGIQPRQTRCSTISQLKDDESFLFASTFSSAYTVGLHYDTDLSIVTLFPSPWGHVSYHIYHPAPPFPYSFLESRLAPAI